MNAPAPVNPFVPGRGHLPPCLAGRSAEQDEMKALLAYLKAGRGAPRDLILSGPRGNGKTVLLRWFQREIEATEQKLDAVWLTPADMRNLDELANLLVPPSRFDSLRPDKLSLAIGLGRFGWELGGRPGPLTQLLMERCQRRPLVLLIDEAHTLGKDAGQALLNASQSVSAEAPFLLALAGTPGLQTHLNSMAATFWSRGRKLGVGLLDEAASAQALTQPLAEQRPAVAFADKALQQVVAESQCYPYFVQLWGAVLWTTTQETGATWIDEALVAKAQSRFDAERSAYYDDRREELKRQGLLQTAARLAPAFRNGQALREHELDAAIAAALPPGNPDAEVDRHRDGLAEVGYVWSAPDEEDLWQPGIPSLMAYIAARAGG